MKHYIPLQIRVIGKVVGMVLFQICLCITMILAFRMTAMKNFIPEPIDDVFGVSISTFFLYSIGYLIIDYWYKAKHGFEAFLIVAALFILGIVGHCLCFASVYYLHGLNCENSNGLYNGEHFMTAVYYSSYIRFIGEHADFCSPNSENKIIPIIQISTTIPYLAVTAGIELYEMVLGSKKFRK